MKVNTISAALKHSRQMQDGEWKGIEVSAEASVNDKGDWTGGPEDTVMRSWHLLASTSS